MSVELEAMVQRVAAATGADPARVRHAMEVVARQYPWPQSVERLTIRELATPEPLRPCSYRFPRQLNRAERRKKQ